MRYLVVLLALVACDLRPAPKDRSAAAGTPTPAPSPTPTTAPGPTPTAPTSDAGVAPAAPADAATRPVVDAMDVSDTCVSVSSHVANVVIESVQDPAHRAVYTQERARMVRRSAEACSRDGWSAERIACYFAASTPDAIQACNKAHAPPPVPTPPSGP